MTITTQQNSAQPENIKQFATGAVRSADAEGERWDLITPIGLRRIAATCHEGAFKYNAFNWERGFAIHDLLNHALRHLYLYLSGDRSEDHLAHAGWNILGSMHSEELWGDRDFNQGTLRGPGCTPPAKVEVEGPMKESAGESAGTSEPSCGKSESQATRDVRDMLGDWAKQREKEKQEDHRQFFFSLDPTKSATNYPLPQDSNPARRSAPEIRPVAVSVATLLSMLDALDSLKRMGQAASCGEEGCGGEGCVASCGREGV